MPRRDGTGPMGMGARTGRRMGHCYSGARRGLKFAIGTGLGLKRGFRNLLRLSLTPEEEISELKAQATALEQGLFNIKERIAELEKEE